jgi:hypothetical protein
MKSATAGPALLTRALGRRIMYRSITAHLQTRSDLLLAGQYEELARYYLLPQAIYLGDSPWVLRDTADAVAAIARLHRRVPTVTALQLPRKGRFRAWVRWSEIATDPALNRASEMVYYFRETPNGLKSEMVEFKQLKLPEFRQDMPARLRTA